MSIIKTEKNMVFIHGPEAGHDVFVVTMFAPQDGSGIYKRLGVQPISAWQSAVDWAVGIADQMEKPLRVGAIGVDAFFRMYGESCTRALSSMSDRERSDLRRSMIATCLEAMRDCPDQDVRADAYETVLKLGALEC